MKSSGFTAKAHPCVNPRRLSHFAWRSVGGSDLTSRVSRKKVRKSREAPTQPVIQWVTTLSVTKRVYQHSFTSCCLQNLLNPAKFSENSNL